MHFMHFVYTLLAAHGNVKLITSVLSHSMSSYPQWLVVKLLVCISSTSRRCIYEQDKFLYKLRLVLSLTK